MEIKLSAGDKINIPENCKATIEDNQIIIEEQKEEFKDGDILHSNMTGRVVIFKSYEDESCRVFCTYYNSANTSNNGWSADCFYHATEEEKQAFFDDLKAKGLRWNAETKTMEKIRERAKIGEKYLTINEFGVVKELREERCTFDNKKFKSGNYYLLSKREQAEEDAKAVRAIFEKRKIENI
ncbi:hypothetical protein [Hoylesella nanceiensis]|uniref:hypothetical protein n=1 Tax=Hoylesella nanceiensis TaxID=425941 RepID=UPI0028E79070|nr:hypothetical protein [Hoylesella nanceiensis]